MQIKDLEKKFSKHMIPESPVSLADICGSSTGKLIKKLTQVYFLHFYKD